MHADDAPLETLENPGSLELDVDAAGRAASAKRRRARATTSKETNDDDRKPSLSRLNSNASGASGRSSLDIPSGSARPVKRGKRDSWNNNHNVDGVNVEDFDDVDDGQPAATRGVLL